MPSWGFGCESVIRTRRVAFAQIAYRFRFGTSAKRCRVIIHQHMRYRSDSVQSDQDLLRARAIRNFAIDRLLVPSTELPNGQPISSWSCWTPAALRQNAKNKTPAPWAIRSPGRFLRRRPAAKRPIGGLMAGSLTLLRCGGGRSPVQINGPNRLLAFPRVRPMALPVHASSRAIQDMIPCAGQ